MKKYILAGLLLTGSTLAWGQKNMVRNGGFETGLDSWRGDALSLNPYDKPVGSHSGMINQFTGAQWKGVDQVIALPKETYAIEFSAWVKTENIEGGKESYNAGAITAEFTTGGESHISYENIVQLTGTNTWTLYKKMVVVPANAKKVRLMLALAQTNGMVLFDEVSAQPYTTAQYEKKKNDELKAEEASRASAPVTFTNGNFEKGNEGWRGSFKLEQTAPKEGLSSASISSEQPVWTGIDQMADVPAGAKTIHVSGWLRAANIKGGKDSWNDGVFILELTKSGDMKAMEDKTIGHVANSTDWTFFEKTLTLPEETTKFRVMLALSNCTGTLQADDIKVTFAN